MLMNPFGRHHPSALGIGAYYGTPVRLVGVDEVLRVCRNWPTSTGALWPRYESGTGPCRSDGLAPYPEEQECAGTES